MEVSLARTLNHVSLGYSLAVPCVRCQGRLVMTQGAERANDRAQYADGVLVPPKPGVTADPKAAAANDGTVITVSFNCNEPRPIS